MIKNKKKLDKFYREIMKKEKLSYQQALKIYTSLYREAIALGVISSRNILDGLDKTIQIAKIVNGLR